MVGTIRLSVSLSSMVKVLRAGAVEVQFFRLRLFRILRSQFERPITTPPPSSACSYWLQLGISYCYMRSYSGILIHFYYYLLGKFIAECTFRLGTLLVGCYYNTDGYCLVMYEKKAG